MNKMSELIYNVKYYRIDNIASLKQGAKTTLSGSSLDIEFKLKYYTFKPIAEIKFDNISAYRSRYRKFYKSSYRILFRSANSPFIADKFSELCERKSNKKSKIAISNYR